MEKVNPNTSYEIRQHLLKMGYGAIDNYITPALTSMLIGERAATGQKVRMFVNARTQDMPITPHSHRFDLACLVVNGWVNNSIYQRRGLPSIHSDSFTVSQLTYGGKAGCYEKARVEEAYFARNTAKYVAGQWYFMKDTDIHSIEFSKDAMVLVFEGPTVGTDTTILEPYVNGETISTFKVEDWMFKEAA